MKIAKTALKTAHTSSGSIGIHQRNCGWPQLGKAYLHIPAGAYGSPIWNFLIDPTMVIPEGMDIKNQGMSLIPRGSYDNEGREIYDIWDRIGASRYRNPTDWLMEVAHFGLHQLIERTAQFGLLSKDSYYIGVHARANIVDPTELYLQRKEGDDFETCPYDYTQHLDLWPDWLEMRETCPGILFNDLVYSTGDVKGLGRDIVKNNASFSYLGYMAPEGIELEHADAAFFKAPFGAVGQFLVYEDKEGNSHEETLKALEALDESMQNVQIVSMDDYEEEDESSNGTGI